MIADDSTFSIPENPILSNICTSFGKFCGEFHKINNNYERHLSLKIKFFKEGQMTEVFYVKHFLVGIWLFLRWKK